MSTTKPQTVAPEMLPGLQGSKEQLRAFKDLLAWGQKSSSFEKTANSRNWRVFHETSEKIQENSNDTEMTRIVDVGLIKDEASSSTNPKKDKKKARRSWYEMSVEELGEDVLEDTWHSCTATSSTKYISPHSQSSVGSQSHLGKPTSTTGTGPVTGGTTMSTTVCDSRTSATSSTGVMVPLYNRVSGFNPEVPDAQRRRKRRQQRKGQQLEVVERRSGKVNRTTNSGNLKYKFGRNSTRRHEPHDDVVGQNVSNNRSSGAHYADGDRNNVRYTKAILPKEYYSVRQTWKDGRTTLPRQRYASGADNDGCEDSRSWQNNNDPPGNTRLYAVDGNNVYTYSGTYGEGNKEPNFKKRGPYFLNKLSIKERLSKLRRALDSRKSLHPLQGTALQAARESAVSGSSKKVAPVQVQ